jgi:hypothetical protein
LPLKSIDRIFLYLNPSSSNSPTTSPQSASPGIDHLLMADE